MKRRTPEHPKAMALQSALACSKPAAVGLLELLWHFAADYAPRGDVGRFGDAQIARAIGYEGDPAELIAALVSSGWLDESDEHRLVIHDWPEHADDYVHLRLARAGLTFADGTEPRKSRMSKAERDRLETAPVKRPASAQKAHGKATAPAVSESKAKAEASKAGAYFDVMSALWPLQPMPSDIGCRRALFEMEATLPPLDDFRSNLESWIRSEQWQAGKIPSPENYIRKGTCRAPDPKRKAIRTGPTLDEGRRTVEADIANAYRAKRVTEDERDALIERTRAAKSADELRAIAEEVARARVA